MSQHNLEGKTCSLHVKGTFTFDYWGFYLYLHVITCKFDRDNNLVVNKNMIK